MTAGNVAPLSRPWEELRREARKLEGELDQRLAAFSRLASSSNTHTHSSSNSSHFRGNTSSSLYSSSGNGQSDDGASLEQKSAQIEKLLHKLADVNDQMDLAVQNQGRGSNDVMMHTLARHRDILQEFMQEFRRTRNAVVSASEHAQLLAGARAIEEGLAGDFSNDGQTEAEKQKMLLRERGGISSATNQVDDLVSQAQAQMQALSNQRSLFGDIGSKVGSVGARFPFMNTMINTIHRKKNKDNIILAVVVSCCTLFLLVYWVSKH